MGSAAKNTAAEADGPRADIVQWQEQAPHQPIACRRQQQEQRQGDGPDERRLTFPIGLGKAKRDAVSIGQHAHVRRRAPPATGAADGGGGIAVGVGRPVDRGPLDGDPQGQVCDQRLCPLDARWRTDLGGKGIDVMLDMGVHDVVEIARERKSQSVHKHHREHHGEQQEEEREPQAQGAPKACEPCPHLRAPAKV